MKKSHVSTTTNLHIGRAIQNYKREQEKKFMKGTRREQDGKYGEFLGNFRL